MKKCYRILPIILVFVSFSANADHWWQQEYPKSEWSIAGGYDIIHSYDDDRRIEEAQEDEPELVEEYWEARYRSELYQFDTDDGVRSGLGLSIYGGSKNTVGFGIYGTYGPMLFGWGIEHAEPDYLTSTEGGYEILLEWRVLDDWSIGLKHRSNCKSVCSKTGLDNILPHGDEDSTNRGWNYLFVRYNFNFDL